MDPKQLDNTKQFTNYVLSVYNLIQSQLITNHHSVVSRAGSTALVNIMYNNKMILLNTGDTRAIACSFNNKAVQLTEDHRPNSKTEYRKR